MFKICILYLCILTFDIQIEGVGPAPPDGVGGLTGVGARVVCGEALQDQAPVAHDDSLPHVLLQFLSLREIEYRLKVLF